MRVTIARAKIAVTEAILAANKLLELARTRSTLSQHNQWRPPAGAFLDLRET